VVIKKYYTDLLRKTLLKKGYFSNSFPKTFNLKSHIGFKPYMGFYVKSLWKGARGTTFLQKGFAPINSYNILLYNYLPYVDGFSVI